MDEREKMKLELFVLLFEEKDKETMLAEMKFETNSWYYSCHSWT